ncbi:MAG TPA: hypothetical protein VLS48_05695 [Anaerolineales bacterium]|nr:hypothetical protein [Anaerolineales bacterium]
MNNDVPNEDTLLSEDVITETSEPTEERPSSRRFIRLLGLLLIILSVLLGWYLLIVYLGWQNGQVLLEEKRVTSLNEQIANQLELAQQDVAEAKYRLAQRRLEWVLEHDPNQTAARTLLTEIEVRQNVQSTPAPQTTPTPTPIPLPTPTPGLISDPGDELTRIQRLVANEAWEDVISALISFQLQYPSYERLETDRLKYEAYLARGLEMISGDKVELGMAYLDEAEKLGDLPQEALDYRLWAKLYLAGIAYYGVNWEIAALNFRELCLSAPFYQSACDRLIESLINLGDQYAYLQEWCPAESYYREASRWGAAVNDQIGQAQAGCAAATPTPGAITDTLSITGTAPLSDTESAP